MMQYQILTSKSEGIHDYRNQQEKFELIYF